MAVTTTTPFEACIILQHQMDSMLDAVHKPHLPYDGNVIRSLKDPANVGTFRIKESLNNGQPATGAGCTVLVDYDEPECGDVSDVCLSACDDLDESPYDKRTLEVTVDHAASRGGYITETDFDCLCEHPNDFIARTIQKNGRAILKQIAIHLSELMYAVTGSYSNGLASNVQLNWETLKLLNPNGFSNPAGMVKLALEHSKQGSSAAPFILGGTFLQAWAMVREVGGINGQPNMADPSFGSRIWVDNDFDMALKQLLGDTEYHFISWTPGAYQFLEWFKYSEGSYRRKIREDYSKTTLTIDGVLFDFELFYDKCTDQWKWTLCKNYDLFYLPEAIYTCSIGNHKLHWIAECADFDCDYQVAPEPVSPAS